MGKILLSLSLKHFDPVNGIKLNHSAGVISQLIFESVKGLGSIEYIDSANNNFAGGKYDLLIGLPRNFNYLITHNKIKKTICFPNIAEGNYLKKVMTEEANKLGCKLSDCFTPSGYYNADYYFILGGKVIFNQFLKYIPKNKMEKVYYRMNTVPFKYRYRNEKTIFLHLATTLGLRKGFWHIVNDFRKTSIDAELWCVGKIQKEKFWIDFANEAKKDKRIKIMGWIDNNDPRYSHIIHQADFIVFKSLGEGQPGSVTEAIEGGCLPILSDESGMEINFTHLYDKNIFERVNKMHETEFPFRQLKNKISFEELYDNNKFKEILKGKVNEFLG